MKVLVVGLGIQGNKRIKYLGKDYFASVDPFNPKANYKKIEDVPSDFYDTVLACIPDQPKKFLLNYVISKKHILVEKPLFTEDDCEIKKIENLAINNNVVCYTAYNHRFEPHFVRMNDLINSGELGEIYSCRMFYGNGTARLVRESEWRDNGDGVLSDLGSHLLDTCSFWFGPDLEKFKINVINCYENKAPDHVIISSEKNKPRIELEMTLCMWRNHFTCDVIAEKGTAHIESLCKWGPATFTHRVRVLPSGRPVEKSVILMQDDPTWKAEYNHFKNLINNEYITNLSKDIWIQNTFKKINQRKNIERYK